jgi:serine protease Do
VDLVLDQPVADPKVRYRAARALAALGAGAPTLSAAQTALATPRGRVLTAARPGEAAAAAAALHPLGVLTAQVPAAAGRAAAPARGEPGIDRGPAGVTRPSRGWAPRVAVAGVAALAAAAVAAFWLGKHPSTDTGPGPPTAKAAASATGGAARLSGRELAEIGLRSTVALHCAQSLGSGFFVTPDLILTNAHVVCPDRSLKVKTADGREGTGTALRMDERLDLALVRVDVAGVPLPLGDAGTLEVGDRVAVVGSPVGMEFSVSQGSVGSVDRGWLGLAYVQTDTAVNPGNSGGPMLDETGHVVGVVSMKKMDAEGIGLALPINYAYTGPEPLVTAPEGTGASGFDGRAQRAEESDRQEAFKLAAVGQRPGIVTAELVGAMIQLRIVWPQPTDPGRQVFHFHLLHKQQRVCSLEAVVTEWKKVEKEDGGSVLPPQMKSWLDRHGLASDFYLTGVRVSYEHCTTEAINHPGLELEMEGADPAASRVRFQ